MPAARRARSVIDCFIRDMVAHGFLRSDRRRSSAFLTSNASGWRTQPAIGTSFAHMGSDDADRSKPRLDISHVALERFGNPDSAIMAAISDTTYDAEAATKAGITAIGPLCGEFADSDLRSRVCRYLS